MTLYHQLLEIAANVRQLQEEANGSANHSDRLDRLMASHLSLVDIVKAMAIPPVLRVSMPEATTAAADGPYRPELAEAFRQGARDLCNCNLGDKIDVAADAPVEEGEGGAWVTVRMLVSDGERADIPGDFDDFVSVEEAEGFTLGVEGFIPTDLLDAIDTCNLRLEQLFPRDEIVTSAPPPRILTVVEGGILTAVISDIPMVWHHIDYDCEGLSHRDGTYEIPQDDGSYAEALRYTHPSTEVRPAFIDQVERAPLIMDGDWTPDEQLDRWIANMLPSKPQDMCWHFLATFDHDGEMTQVAGLLPADNRPEAAEMLYRALDAVFGGGSKLDLTLRPPVEPA